MPVRIDLPSVTARLPAGVGAPLPLEAFAAWLGGHPHGAVGYFDALAGETVDPGLLPRSAPSDAIGHLTVFLWLPDGSRLALWHYGPSEPAVVLLSSEGEHETIAVTFRAFLALLSRGETRVGDLDGPDAGSGREALARWLEEFPVSASDEGRRPSFGHWLASGELRYDGIPRGATPEVLAALEAHLVPALERRVDEPEAKRLLEAIWDGPLPSAVLGSTYLPNKPGGFCVFLKAGAAGEPIVEGCFFYAGGSEGYERFPGVLPGGVSFDDDRETLVARLGPVAFERVSKKTGRVTGLRFDRSNGTLVWASYDRERLSDFTLSRLRAT
ncbi:MAG: hypothetical protein U0183_33865 [Polyangiaceae bacterium]